MDMISEDKKTITLPVPLGSTVYTFRTDCDNQCCWDENGRIKTPLPRACVEKLEERNRSMRYFCYHEAPCHTIYKGTESKELSLPNLYIILDRRGTEWFATRLEADAAGKALIAGHRLALQARGIGTDTEKAKKYDFIHGFNPLKLQEYVSATEGGQPHDTDEKLQG